MNGSDPASFPAVVTLEGVTHRYKALCALNAVTLAFPAGQRVGLIGPDGVGKSTLLGLAAGVRRLQQGSLSILGGDARHAGHRQACRQRIAYMPQGLGSNLYPTLSIRDNLDFFARLYGLPSAQRPARMARLLHATGLAPFADRPAGKLSGGMKQKLGLCCALIHDPDLLILDEPTTGVDPLSRRQFWELLDAIRAERPHMSVLIATAYMEEAERFDWLAALYAGRIIAQGTPAQLHAQSGCTSLDAAFIALLPTEARQGYQPVHVMPLTTTAADSAIEARGLTRRFGTFTAVDNVSFRIRRGEIFGFLGSNGCGKTTTMKMLTGLLPATTGSVTLFGHPLNVDPMTTRRRVGYMSQSFSLYAELSVLQNLRLHARLYDLPRESVQARIDALLERYQLAAYRHQRPQALPLGIKQRLQLAVAVLHGPELLILDEPTSGVDPVARDMFWRQLIRLSREEGVTIFISTHFMNEAERCDRISLMHAGRVLALDTPAALAAEAVDKHLETTFIHRLEQAAAAEEAVNAAPPPDASHLIAPCAPRRSAYRAAWQRLWAYARRETNELLHDRIRLSFALLGPLLLMLTFGYGISFDVERLRYTVLDQDQSRESRAWLENLEGSHYFTPMAPVANERMLVQHLQRGDVTLGIEIPPGFGRRLMAGEPTEVEAIIDGAIPFRGETARGYLESIAQQVQQDEQVLAGATSTYALQPRFRYNQAFRSVDAIVPGVIMMMLALIPAMMTAVGVVREKESGSIANFRASPTTGLEFLLGKQLPYIGVAMITFVAQTAMALGVFGLQLKGSLPALTLGALGYTFATTGFGLLMSTFTRSQVAAIFSVAVLTVLPAINFSGLLTPVSSLSGIAQVLGLLFPAGWFQPISLGVFTKGRPLAQLWPNIMVLFVFGIVFLGLARLAMRKQEA